jgi:hypothetical protein
MHGSGRKLESGHIFDGPNGAIKERGPSGATAPAVEGMDQRAEFREGYALDEAAAALVPLNAVGQNETGPCRGRALS